MAPSETTLEFCNRLWDNWTPRNGDNQCEDCPAHWSNRSDFPGDRDTRQSSHGHRPWYGDGDLDEVEIVILGHEPGRGSIGDEGDNETNHTKNSFEDVRNPNISEVPDNAGSLSLTKPLFERIDSELSAYWTQAKKCNELAQNNSSAERQCAGIGDNHEGYLADELSAVNPGYVVGLGADVYRIFSDVFDVDSLGGEFNRPIATGNSESGLRVLDVDGYSFKYIPTAHPSRGVRSETKEEIDLSGLSGKNDSERYYKLFADDLVSQIQSGEI